MVSAIFRIRAGVFRKGVAFCAFDVPKLLAQGPPPLKGEERGPPRPSPEPGKTARIDPPLMRAVALYLKAVGMGFP